MISIHVRPPEANVRSMRGHCLTKSAGNKSAVGVLVERTTRPVAHDASTKSALAAFTTKLRLIAAPLRQMPTYNQDKEIVRHRQS